MLRNLIILLFLIPLLFSSCRDETIVIPEGVFSQDTAVMVFAELHILEGFAIHASLNQENSAFSAEAYRKGVLEKFGLSKEKFDSSYYFYLSNPILLDKVYAGVLNELSRQKAEAEN